MILARMMRAESAKTMGSATTEQVPVKNSAAASAVSAKKQEERDSSTPRIMLLIRIHRQVSPGEELNNENEAKLEDATDRENAANKCTDAIRALSIPLIHPKSCPNSPQVFE